MGDGQGVVRSTGCGLEPVPELFGVTRLVVGERQVRHVVAAEDDDPMPVDATRRGRPLEAVERREPAWVVVALRDVDDASPDRPGRVEHLLLRGPDVEPRRIGPDHAGDDDLDHAVDVTGPTVGAGDLRRAVSRDPLAGGVPRRVVCRVGDEPVLAQPLGVLGDRGEVERPAQLGSPRRC